MSGKRYPDEFKIEAVNWLLIVVIPFQAWQHALISPLTVFMRG